MPLPEDPAIRGAFDTLSEDVRPHLLAMRELIYQTAEATPGVGQVVETLKWGQPAYQTVNPKSGTTLRLGVVKSHPQEAAIFVHCGTSLIETYTQHYGDRLNYEGRRAILFPTDTPLPEEVLRHCIALALTYHLKS